MVSSYTHESIHSVSSHDCRFHSSRMQWPSLLITQIGPTYLLGALVVDVESDPLPNNNLLIHTTTWPQASDWVSLCVRSATSVYPLALSLLIQPLNNNNNHRTILLHCCSARLLCCPGNGASAAVSWITDQRVVETWMSL